MGSNKAGLNVQVPWKIPTGTLYLFSLAFSFDFRNSSSAVIQSVVLKRWYCGHRIPQYLHGVPSPRQGDPYCGLTISKIYASSRDTNAYRNVWSACEVFPNVSFHWTWINIDLNLHSSAMPNSRFPFIIIFSPLLPIYFRYRLPKRFVVNQIPCIFIIFFFFPISLSFHFFLLKKLSQKKQLFLKLLCCYFIIKLNLKWSVKD